MLSKRAQSSALTAALREGRQFASAERAPTGFLSSINTNVRTFAQGRVHAQQELSAIDQWRQQATDAFVGAHSPARRSYAPMASLSEAVPRSPGHFERLYRKGNFCSPRVSPRKQLEPLLHSPRVCSSIVHELEPGDYPPGRAASNLQARAACWRGAPCCVQAVADPAGGHSVRDIAGAPGKDVALCL